MEAFILKINLMYIPKLLMAVLAVGSFSWVGCNSGQSVSVNVNQGISQTDDSRSGSDSQTNGAVGVTATESETVHIGSIDWYVDYDKAMKVVMESNKPIWLHFGENHG